MSNNDYNASVVIETATAYKGMSDLATATDAAAVTFKNLDSALKGSNTNLKDAAAALKSIVESQRQAAAATKDLSAARIAEAKAAGLEAKNTADATAASDRHTLSQQREATAASQGAAAEARKANTVAQGVRATEAATAASERRAVAERKAASASLEVTDHLSNSRYLLYDVAATYGTISAGLLAIPAATAAVAIAYERDFAQVIRTNDALWGNQEATDALRSSLKDLATEIPTSFSELSNIASIGGQLGIASEKMGQFTETVAKFGAASNVTTEDAATAFGRLENAFPKDAQAADFFNKIGSAVAYVGVKSVATESEIIAVVNQLSPLAAQAGFTAQEVVGLSGALASVRIRPELARGAFLSTMTKMTSAADQGATAFETYAKYLDMTGAAGVQLFKTDPGAFFTKFVQGIKGSIDSGNSFSSVMSDLGVKEKRETQFLLALANGHEVLGSAMANSAEAYNKGTFLDDSTAGVFSTVSAELVKLGNAFKNLADSLGGSSLGMFGKFLEMLNGVVTGVSHLIDTVPAVGAVITGFLGFGAVVGVLLAFKGAQAAALAAVVAFRQVVGANIQQSISLSGVMKELSVTMLQARGATLAQAQAYVQANGALAAYRTGVVSTNVANRELQIGTATTATGMGRMLGGVKGAGTALMGLAGGPIGIAITALALLGGAFFQAKADAESAAEAITTAMSAGAEQGAQAIGDRLNKMKVGFFSNTDSRFTDLGKSIGELGDQAGVGMDKMIAAVMKGKGAGDELTKTLDEIAKRKGYMNFAEWDNSNSTVFDTQLSNLRDIQRAVIGLGNDTDKSGTAAKRSADAVKALGGAAAGATPAIDENGDAIGKTGDAADDATKKIQTYIDSLFGLINAEGATNASLEKLGAGLSASTSFSAGDSGGRDNLAALQETFRNAALYQKQLIDSNQQSAQQAQANYVAFVEGLYSELASRGVDVAAIQGLADQTKHVFDSALADENALNAQATVSVKVDDSSVGAARAYLDQIVATYGELDATVILKQEGGEQVNADVAAMEAYILAVTGEPYVVKPQANTAPAIEGLGQVGDFAASVSMATYEMAVNADISPATAALQVLQQFAASIMNGIIDGLNAVDNLMSKVTHMGGGNQLSHVGWGQVSLPTPTTQKKAPVAPVLPTAPKAAASLGGGAKQTEANVKGLDSLGQGYDKAAEKAAKAGGAGEKAGKDMANGIDDATKAVNDYANRLGQGLKSAFDQQYGLQTATDAYYTTLNSITKKRQDDLKSIQDLITKQKELNNARNSDLVDARKAGVEKKISIKYGESDRAADYANQEQTALDNAAAKQKDIQANKDNQKSLQDGMNALTGYSQAAIDNRAALRDLESKMTDMIVAYANTGKSQSQVDAYTRSLTSKFQQQVSQLGYNRTAVANLQGNMERYSNVVRNVPTRVNTSTTTSGTGQAAGALNGVRNAANGIPKNVNTRVHTDVSVTYLEVYDPYGTLKGLREIKNGKTQPGVQLAYNKGGQIPGFASGGRVPGTAPSNPSADNMLAKVDGKGLVKIRSNEWIIQEPAVKYYGNDFMDNLNNMRLPKFAMGGQPSGGSMGGGAGDGGPMLVQLTAQNITDLLRASDRPVVLYTENTMIASSANKGNAILAATGAN